MAKNSIDIPEIGPIFVTKKRGQRTIRLRVDTKGTVQVSMPWLVPQSAAVSFALTKKDWIKQQQSEFSFQPYNGMLFGKTLQLMIQENSDTIRARQDGKHVIVPFAGKFQPGNSTHLEKIKKAMMKALRTEAEVILLPRLREFADEYGFTYTSSGVKQVVGRWGSCDSNGHISLSLYLTQLPIEYIDYVLIHELAHTIHLNHSPAFWQLVGRFCPDYKNIRQKMRGLQPKIYDAKAFMA